MKKHIISLFAVMGAFLAVTSCSDDKLPGVTSSSTIAFTPKGELVDAYLNLSVSGLTVATATRADVEDTEEEHTINNLWVFQYDATSDDAASQQLIAVPQYLTISDQTTLANVPVKLSNNDGDPFIIYVVTNTGDSAWATYSSDSKNYSGFMTVEGIKVASIPKPNPQRMIYDNGTYIAYGDGDLSIPMSGSKKATVSEGTTITVDVQRMFAKLYIRVDLSNFNNVDYNDVEVNNVTVANIPEYCRVNTLFTDETEAGDYAQCPQFIALSFTGIEDESTSEDIIYPYVIYVPENIQGVNGSSEDDKSDNIPQTSEGYNASVLSVTANINIITKENQKLSNYPFTAYPGGDNHTNFNVKRNCVYYLNMVINNLDENDLIQPSANCIICLSGETTAFYPYYRPEKGGGYEFINYLNYVYGTEELEDGTEIQGNEAKRIDYVKIIWQSQGSDGKGYIGNNSGGNLVWIDDAPTDGTDEEKTQAEYKRKINVAIPSNEVGNALIGAYHKDDTNGDKLIWSWHIWSRLPGNDPSNEGNAVRYTTYDWDTNGINPGKYKSGYLVMNCNLGALANTPTDTSNGLAPFGTLYQWGRKDPFPPITTIESNPNYYNSTTVGNYYGNDNSPVTITEGTDESYLFHSVAGEDRSKIGTGFDDYIDFSILNPTVFICGTIKAGQVGSSNDNYASSKSNYVDPQDGNWISDSSADHYNCLWGGLDPESTTDIMSYEIPGYEDALGNKVHLYDDYGEDKSIFDPCPYGWRVSPPDQWLGFTSTGLNPLDYSEINSKEYDNTNHGFYMYMNGWKEDATYTSYFPCQGTRIADGSSYRVGSCGNYHNATADANDRVNILHMHNSTNLFHIFEITYLQYYVKSVAGPVRCVRMDSLIK